MILLTELGAGGSLRVPMTYAGYQALGETKYTEYYDGVVTGNPPTKRHVIVNRRLTVLLDRNCPEGFEVLPEAGWETEFQTVYIPDVMIAQRGAPGPDVLRIAPLLVGEITSPSTRFEDVGRKLTAYAQAGADWYWIIDPNRNTVTVLQNDRHGRSTQAAEHRDEDAAVALPPMTDPISPLELFSE